MVLIGLSTNHMAKALEEYTPQKKAEAMSITKELSSIFRKDTHCLVFQNSKETSMDDIGEIKIWKTLRN